MKIKLLVFHLMVFFVSSAPAKKFGPGDLPWTAKLKDKGVEVLSVCGNSEIQVNKKSLAKNFVLGNPPRGLVFSDLIGHEDYLEILKNYNLEGAKESLKTKFEKTHLWLVNSDSGIEDLGGPTKIELPFSASVKDCVEGAPSATGLDCRGNAGCCFEKFRGPIIYWGKNSEYKLLYSPDPSVRLKAPGEKKHRYCNIQEKIEI